MYKYDPLPLHRDICAVGLTNAVVVALRTAYFRPGYIPNAWAANAIHTNLHI